MNRHTSPIRRGLAALTALAVLLCQIALPPQVAEASQLGSSTASAGSVAPPTAMAVQSFQPDLFTGRATTSVPIAVPPGRKGMQPALGLAYSSSARNGWVGVGWGLDLGYIERSTKNGVPKYDATDTYTFMFQGVSSELVAIGGNEYRAKDEGLFLRFCNLGTHWEVQDKAGTVYRFGQSTASQIVDSSRVFRWALDAVVDMNGNGLTITYTTDQGQLYPQQIFYTTHTSGTPAPINRVTFTLDSRTDVETSYRAGFAVTTAQRLTSISTEVLVTSAWRLAKRYDLVYHYSPRTGRSLLTSVQQFGTDGETSLPATTFDYQDTGAATYTLTPSSAPTNPPTSNFRVQMAGDVDGNGITDLITLDATSSSNGIWTVACSQSSTFAPPQTWLSNFGGTSSVPLIGDWNADGLTDIGIYSAGAWQFATSNATAFQTGAIASLTFGSGTPLTGDFNGDGLVDVGTFDNGAWRVALNTGSSFSSTAAFDLNWGSSLAPLTGDFNGDGLTDIATAQSSSGTIEMRLSTGAGWTASKTWRTAFGTTQNTHTTADFNGDGLTDAAFYNRGAGQVTYAPSTGQDFGPPQTLPVTFSLRSSDDYMQVADFNGDGHADPGVFHPLNGNAEIAGSRATFPDLLSAVRNGLGGSTTLEYQASTQCDNNCPITHTSKLPFILPVVRRVTTEDGMNHSYSATYLYKQGRYDAATREFRGFGKVEARDAIANVTTTLFHQDEHNKGRRYHTELRDAQGTLWSTVDQTWSCTESAGVHFVHLDRTESRSFDGNATSRATASRFTYDAYGNITRTEEEGDVAVTGDERHTVTTYLNDTAAWLLGKPEIIKTLAADGTTIVAQRRFSYERGNLTKEEEWLNKEEDPATHALVAANRWLPTTLDYDAFGNVTQVHDALSRLTTNTFDSTSTYLVQIQNTLGHTRRLEYDFQLGQVTRSIDQNAQPTRTEYDALGRPLRIFGPLSDTIPVLSYEYQLAAAPPSRTITRARVSLDTAEELVTYTFTDGLGRVIQTRSMADDANKQVVSGAVAYDALGRVVQQWAPYLDDLSTSYRPHTLISGLAAPATYAYDVLGRIVKTIDPDGTEALVEYDDGATTSTVIKDGAELSRRRQGTDGYGRLSSVDEFHSATELHTTRYTYDILNNLVTVTDAAGNRTALVYDSLGRKIGMDDPDMGTWTYAYDDVDNLLRQTDARLIETHFAYDALNRLKQKTYTRPAGSAVPLPAMVTYTYDGTHVSPAKPNSVGKLSKIVDGSGDSTFQYDVLGRLTKESKTINSSTYTTERAYDLLGRLTSVTYPGPGIDVARYTYNNQGGLKSATLQRYTSGGALQSTAPLISGSQYNAAGQLTQLTYGNGVVTDYAYNPLTLRLSSLQTTHPITGTLQQFAYGFDGLGNVSSITGAAANVSGGTHPVDQDFEYDGLSRLTRAQGPYGDFQYAYDAIGNMTSKEGRPMNYSRYNAGPHAVTNTWNPQDTNSLSSGWDISYDANGNMLQKAPSICAWSDMACLATQRFTFDAENRLVAVDTPTDTTVSVTFQPGWNFFSLPVIPDEREITALFPQFAARFEQIARQDDDGVWEHYVGLEQDKVSHEKFNAFTELDYGVGYQVYAKQPVTIAFTGKLPTKRLLKDLSAGWHLLPALVVDSPKPTSWLTTGLSADAVLKINSTTGVTAPATEIAAGQAYWVHLTRTGTFSPSLPRDPTTTFVYDGDGGRVKQITAAGTTLYLGELQEQTPDGTVTKHLFAGSQRLASLVIPASGASSLRFFHGDHLGSTNLVTDSTGKVIEVSENTPYGTLYHHEGSATSPHQFTGQRLDPSTGLYFYNARYYDAQLGRFISPDPFVQAPDDPQTLNRYSYVRNNPVNLVDPSGYKWSWKTFFGIVAAVALVIATAGAAAPGVAAAAGAYGAAEVAAGTLASWATTAAVVSAASGAAYLATPSSSGAFSGAGIAALGVGGAGAMALAGSPGLATAGGAPFSMGGRLGALTAGALAEPSPLGEAALGTALAGILLYQGSKALRQTLDDAIYRNNRQSREIIGYHAKSFTGAAYDIARGNGFRIDRSDLDGTARFGPGFYLASTPEGAVAELAKQGLTTNVVLEVRAKLTRNFTVGGPLAERPISRYIGAAVQSIGGSITYGSFAAPGVTNYVLFNPAEQQQGPVRVIQYGAQ